MTSYINFGMEKYQKKSIYVFSNLPQPGRVSWVLLYLLNTIDILNNFITELAIFTVDETILAYDQDHVISSTNAYPKLKNGWLTQ